MKWGSRVNAREFEIRPLLLTDKERWLELWEGYLAFYSHPLTSEQNELTWSRIHDPHFNLYGLVAKIDGAVVGFTHYLFTPSSWAMNQYCYLEDLYVDPTVRGVGAGRSLIDAVIAVARAKFSEQVYWTTREGNNRARVLYDSYLPASDFVQYRLPQSY